MLFGARLGLAGVYAPMPSEGFRAAGQFRKRWIRKVAHKDGILQRLNHAIEHLVEESKPAVALVSRGQGGGSGFIVEPEGLMVTNAHVVKGLRKGDSVNVTFPNGVSVQATIVAVGNPADRDLALLQLPPKVKGWPYLTLGVSGSVQEGHMVVALGFPLGLPFTVTQGVVSGKGNRGKVGVKFMQTDASINPGNSGGPLLAMDGTVIGVNTSTMSPARNNPGSVGLGFSITSDDVRQFISDVRTGKEIAGPEEAAQLPCPPLAALDGSWVEAPSRQFPGYVMQVHRERPLAHAAPMLVAAPFAKFWVGMVHRSNRIEEMKTEAGCLVVGTVAYYVIGRDGDPEIDFVAAVNAGGEGALNDRLIEVRWFDLRENKRYRWYNETLAERLGWTTQGNGEQVEGRPIPLASTPNSLY